VDSWKIQASVKNYRKEVVAMNSLDEDYFPFDMANLTIYQQLSKYFD